MALGSIKKAYDVFKRHDFSRSFQLRILDVGDAVPSYVRSELIGQEGRVYATSYNVPGRSVGNIDIPYQGFNFKLPGQVAYENNPWVVNFRTPGDYLVRNAFERWSFATANDETSCGMFNMPCENSSIDIAVMSPKCEVIRVYRLHGVYLSNISEIVYNQETAEGTTFSAALHYQYWRPAGGYDTGINESGAAFNGTIDNTFQGFANTISQGNAACPTGLSTM
jgi:hypothetical protein